MFSYHVFHRIYVNDIDQPIVLFNQYMNDNTQYIRNILFSDVGLLHLRTKYNVLEIFATNLKKKFNFDLNKENYKKKRRKFSVVFNKEQNDINQYIRYKRY